MLQHARCASITALALFAALPMSAQAATITSDLDCSHVLDIAATNDDQVLTIQCSGDLNISGGSISATTVNIRSAGLLDIDNVDFGDSALFITSGDSLSIDSSRVIHLPTSLYPKVLVSSPTDGLSNESGLTFSPGLLSTEGQGTPINWQQPSPSGTLTVTFTGGNVVGTNSQFYGNLQQSTQIVSLSSGVLSTGVVPEPATYALMGLGLIGISLATRRRASV